MSSHPVPTTLLSLPSELHAQILAYCYPPWKIYLRKLEIQPDGSWQLQAGGFPSPSPMLIHPSLTATARKAELASFLGTVVCEESDTATLGLTINAFMLALEAKMQNASKGLIPHAILEPEIETLPRPASDSLPGEVNGLALSTSSRYTLMQKNLHTLRFHSLSSNPSLWKLHITFSHFPSLKRVILDCRYQSHFAIHNVPSKALFLDKSAALERIMDFRKSFFLSCEKFFMTATERGVRVNVIRAMGVREGREKCVAVACAVDYFRDGEGKLALDMEGMEVRECGITEWPNGIRRALEELQGML